MNGQRSGNSVRTAGHVPLESLRNHRASVWQRDVHPAHEFDQQSNLCKLQFHPALQKSFHLAKLNQL
jgi:hypothetical protein